MPPAHPTKSLVIIHAEVDSAAVVGFGVCLASLVSSDKLKVWHLENIPFGRDRFEAIQETLQGADVVAFWVSPKLLDNNKEFDFVCTNAGLIPPTAQIVPIIARPAIWEALPYLKQYESNVLPANQQPMPSESEGAKDAWMDEVARSVAQKLGLMEPKPNVIFADQQPEPQDASMDNLAHSLAQKLGLGVPKLVATRPFWKRITPGEWLGAVVTILLALGGFYFAYPSFVADSRENEEQAKPEPATPPPSDPGCDFPVHFVQDTLYVLIARFEGYPNKDVRGCHGEGIERRIDRLVERRKLPIYFRYCDAISPNQRDVANRLRAEFQADLIIWGQLKNADQACKAEGTCLQFEPSDTLIRYAGGEIRKPKLGDYQDNITGDNIEYDLINMGDEVFEEWLVGMFNLKIGKRKPELSVIDEGWDTIKRLEAYRTRGNIWAGLGRYNEAITDFDQAIKLNPNDALLYSYRGGAKDYLGRQAEAITDFDQSIILDSKNATSYYNRGISKSKLGHSAEAILDYNQAIAIDPKHAYAYFNRGVAKHKSGHSAEAILDYNQAIAIDSNYAYAYYNRGKARDNFNEAINDLTQAIKIDPNLAAAYNTRGVTKGKLGDHNGSLADLTQAIKIDPNFSIAYNNRGGANDKLGHVAEAIVDFDQSIKIDPNFAAAYINRGCSRETIGRYTEAMADFNQSIKIDPKSIQAYENRGELLYKLGRHTESIADFSQVIKIDPKNGLAYNNRAGPKVALRRFDEAIADLDQAVKIDSNFAAAFSGRGNIKKSLSRYTEALADYTQAIAINPKDASAYVIRGDFRYDLRNYAKAIDDYNQALEIRPKFVEVYYKRSAAKQKNSQPISAFADYCHATWHDPSKWWVWYLLLPVLAGYTWKFKTMNRLVRHLFARFLPQKSVKTPTRHATPARRRKS